MENLASGSSKQKENKEEHHVVGGEVVSAQQKAKDKLEVDRIVSKRKRLTQAEITSVVDLLISLCKYYQVGDKHALTLGCHLLPNFFSQAHHQLKQVIMDAKQERNAEFMVVNFELRSKHFIELMKKEQ